MELSAMSSKVEKKYSLATIAAELGISKSAVSFVLNGNARNRRISPELEERIRDFCRKVNYRPNIHAQRMNGVHVNNIGILLDKQTVPLEKSPFREYNVANIVGGIADAAAEAGYRFSCQFYYTDMSDDVVFNWIENKEISGLIYYGLIMPERWVEFFRKQNFKTVGISIDPACGLPCVNVDNYGASFKLVETLISRGRRHFMYVSGSSGSYPGAERYRGFRDVLKKYEIEFDEKNFLPAEYNREFAARMIRERWMKNSLNVDAIVCGNDNMAIGVIQTLKDAGIKVPDEIAVVGADNSDMCEIISPALTSFDNLPFEQGQTAFRLLKSLICDERESQNIVLNTTLSLRRSG